MIVFVNYVYVLNKQPLSFSILFFFQKYFEYGIKGERPLLGYTVNIF